jgi:hypothetical protein
MRANAVILIVIGLLLLVGTAGALVPDTVSITSNKNWIVANNVDQSTITVTVTNNSLVVPNANVAFSINNTLGSLSSAGGTTGSSGTVSTNFKANTKSGATLITAMVTYSGADGSYMNTVTLTQNIDHDVPVNVNLKYPLEGEVATEVPFNISVVDRWGNLVDGRNTNEVHSVSLRVDCPDTYCGFKDGSLYTQMLSRNLDINGTLPLQIRLSKKIGDHNIQIASPFTLARIIGIATGIPTSMTGTISDGGVLPANNIDFFVIKYFLYDVYGNPVQNRSILARTNLTDELSPKLYTTNSLGEIQIAYGPKISVLTSQIIANSTDNPMVSNVLIANFVASDGTNMVLAATPMTMGSRDVAPTEKSYVTATVIDTFGNPVPGEVVTFSLGSINIGAYNQTVNPSLSVTSATTDGFGNALVYFYPGSFTSDRNAPGYDSHATGSAVITATWSGTTRLVTVTWKNYPYLSIETSASKSNLKLNETVDITIDVTGNGYLMGGNSITAVLDQDTSASIYGSNKDPSEKYIDSITAAKAFVGTCVQGKDYIGVTAYSDTSDVINLAPTASLSLVNLSLNNLKKGNKAWLNESISHAIHNMTDTQPSRPIDTVRAVIVLEDPGGAALTNDEIDAIQAEAASTTPFTYLFVVYYDTAGGGTKCNGAGYGTAIDLPNGPNQFECLGNANDLIKAYQNFSATLHSRAGVNASLLLNFQNIEVNGNQTPGNNVSVYVPAPDPALSGGFANLVTPAPIRDQVQGRTRIMWQNNSYSVINQSNEWNTGVSPFGVSHQPYQLYFNIGTMEIGNKWNTTYRLRMINETGLINLFNCSISSSALAFDDGNGIVQPPLCLPDLYLTVNQNITPVGLQSGVLDLSDLKVSGPVTDSIPFQWNLSYTGFLTVTETIYYSYNDAPWILSETRTSLPSNSVYVHTGQLNVVGIKEGSYRIKVHADTPDAGSDEMIIGTPSIGNLNATIFLK